jgi:hypothetical protein
MSTVTAAEYQDIVSGKKPGPKRAKYGNKKTNGFDSAKEARRAADLALMEKAGKIANLRSQVAMSLQVNGEHVGAIVVDFVYERAGRTVYEDVKSQATITPLFKWKAKHFLAQYGTKIELYV